MPPILRWLLAILAFVGVAGWVLTMPDTHDAAAFDGLVGDAEAGALAFAAGGCSSCHAAPGASGADKLVLAGGQRLETPFGTFVASNISPGPAGIGGWSLMEFANAVQRGVSPEGAHYYPAFPYASYSRASDQDIADMFAYIQTLPVSDRASEPHDMAFPVTVRRGIGLWKALNMPEDWHLEVGDDPVLLRGRELAEGLGHCAECHTPRDATGGLDRARWMAGAENPSGPGRIPGITPDQLFWSAFDLEAYFESGFTPEFDSAGGSMASVIENLAQLPASDRAALAAYVKALPAAD
ncbi:c-type cytochrome [Pseudaestuariivita sp.]|uniref:c-type cytochrome n=1 Tax=Pseudaestuariivita sp. TaxID=2211669 RepID=UPI004057FAA6